MRDRRVVISGIGTINPLGDNKDEFYENLMAGKSGIKAWKSLDLSELECKIGGDLATRDYTAIFNDYLQYLPENRIKKIRKLFKGTTFSAKISLICALQAYKDAKMFEKPPADPYAVSLPVAGHNFNSNYIFKNFKNYLEDPDYIDPLSSIDGIDPNLPAVVSEVLGIHGPSFTLGGACASGNLALREGFNNIKSGESDTAIVVGPPFDVSPADIQASVILGAVVVKPEYHEHPEKSSRPFDKNRCGFLYSHGSATLVIETLENAQARGAHIYAEILAVNANANANHLPIPGAENQERVMQKAIKMAGLVPTDFDYINCHATSTYEGDLQEIIAIKNVFKEHVYKLKMNAPKSMLGHTCWASPLVETIAALMQMQHAKLHPTINLDNPDPEIAGLEMCANKSIDHQIEIMLKNSFGFGGINCCSIIKRFHS